MSNDHTKRNTSGNRLKTALASSCRFFSGHRATENEERGSSHATDKYSLTKMDATTLQILDEPNRDPGTKSYVYCFRGGGKGYVVTLYDYNECKHQQYVAEWLQGFSGYIHSDADSFFSKIYSQNDVHSVLCNAHARRKFESISKQSKKKGLAYHAMTLYSKLYKIERKAKKEKRSASQRYELRQKHSKPILKVNSQ